jgi:hypothetical protein
VRNPYKMVWDNPYRFQSESAGFSVYHPCDAGLKRRCQDCLSQVAADGLRCDLCAYKRNRRLGKI